MKTPEQEANELVEMFWIYSAANDKGSWNNAVNIAVLHVERLIEVLDSFGILGEEDANTIIYYQQVLQILKDKK